MILIIGTPDSGKSALAEDTILKLCESQTIAYIATMEPFGEEGKLRIERHRKLRSGKGFITFEKYQQVQELASDFEESLITGALLECVSNLVGNEMEASFNQGKSDEELAHQICEEIKVLDDCLQSFVVVTNEFELLETYDDKTKRYIKLTSLVNEQLKRVAIKYMKKEESGWVVYENN